MPYKENLCGIYMISTPNGSKYVGSSHNIYGRWSEHRYHLKRGTHHSKRLQNAWNKHKENLKFEVILLCNSDILEKEEQRIIDEVDAQLNTSKYVGNVWCNPEIRAKIMATYKTKKWIEKRKALAKKTAEKRGIKVDCSDGSSYSNLHEAGKAYGVNPSSIAHLIKTQRIGRLGVKFKKSSDEWWDIVSASEQRYITMIENGKHSTGFNRKADKRTQQRMAA